MPIDHPATKTRLQALARDHAPYAGVFAHGMGQSMVFAMLPALGREVGLAEVAIGAVISMSSLVFFIGSRAWGRISDRWGRKPVILCGLWGYSIGTLVFALRVRAGDLRRAGRHPALWPDHGHAHGAGAW